MALTDKEYDHIRAIAREVVAQALDDVLDNWSRGDSTVGGITTTRDKLRVAVDQYTNDTRGATKHGI